MPLTINNENHHAEPIQNQVQPIQENENPDVNQNGGEPILGEINEANQDEDSALRRRAQQERLESPRISDRFRRFGLRNQNRVNYKS